MPHNLRFTPYAFAKLAYLRDKGDTEVGGYGISDAQDPLLVIDFVMVEQECTSVFCELDGADANRMMAEMAELGITADRCCRIWIHTHPGNSAQPSSVDESTFDDNYSSAPWSVMAILAKGGETYARIQYKVRSSAPFGDETEMYADELKWQVDYSLPFNASCHEAWDSEYDTNLKKKTYATVGNLPVPARYSSYQSNGYRYWQNSITPSPQIQWTDRDAEWVGDTYVSDDDSTVWLDEWVQCSDCNHTWLYDDAETTHDLMRCPICNSTEVDFADPPHHKYKRGFE